MQRNFRKILTGIFQKFYDNTPSSIPVHSKKLTEEIATSLLRAEIDKAQEQGKKAGFYWHSGNDRLISWCSDEYKRRYEIGTTELAININIHQRLFHCVQGELPKEIYIAEATFKNDYKTYLIEWSSSNKKQQDLAWINLDKAREVYYSIWNSYRTEIEDLHTKECPNCLWNGNRIVYPPIGKWDYEKQIWVQRST